MRPVSTMSCYTSAQAPKGRDALGTAIKFSVPTVANGYVYVGTNNKLVAYGLLNPPAAATQTDLNSATASQSSAQGGGQPTTGQPLLSQYAPLFDNSNGSGSQTQNRHSGNSSDWWGA